MLKKISSDFFCFLLLLVLVFFCIPIEHKYDKLFRFYSYTLIPNGLELPKLFDPKIYFYISDLVGIIFFILGIWQIRKSYQERGSIFLALLFLGALTSILASPFCSYPMIYIRLFQFLTPLALFFFIANNPYPKEHIFKICTWALFGAGLFQGAISIIQYFNQHMLGLRIIGEQALCATIPSPDGHRWVFDQLFHRFGKSGTIFRAMGTMPHPNVMGGFFAVALFITSYLFFIHKKWRFWLAPAYLIQLFAMALTYSRSAFFAYTISSILWMIWLRWRQKISIQSVATLILVCTTIVGILLHEQIYSRGGIVNYNETARQSDLERLFYQDIALKMIRQHPFLGVGFGQFASQSSNYLSPELDLSQIKFSCVHNIFLLIAAEMGLFSLAIFLCWVGIMIWCGWRATDYLIETALLWSLFIGFLFIGCCDYYPIVFQQGKLLFFGLAGLLARFGCFEKKQPQN